MLKLAIFGPLQVRSAELCVGAGDFPGTKPRQLLEILAAARGHGVTKERLAHLLWGDAQPLSYLATLESYISVLRQTLEPGVRARDSLVVTEHGGYRLDTAQVELDLDVFDAHVESSHGLEPRASVRELAAALALVRGEVLEDEPYAPWADELRAAYVPRHVDALVAAGRMALLLEDPRSALGHAQQAISLNPLAEAAWQVQMCAAYLAGRQDDALQSFDRFRRLLSDELGVDPLPQTADLHVAILRHGDPLEVVRQLVPHRASPVSFATTASASGLIGRESELAQLEQVVARARAGRFSTVLVYGDQGIGKTSLARAAAERSGMAVGRNRCSDLEQSLPYLALSLALRALSGEPVPGLPVLDELMERVERQLPFDDFARLRAMEQLVTSLSSRDRKPTLLLLDDVQFADSETLRTLGFLQRRCPDLPIALLLTCDRKALADPPLRDLEADLRLELDVLSADVLGDETLYAATGGHPLFISGWRAARGRGLSEPFPPELTERILSWCWSLGARAYRLLSLTSALDEPVVPEVLAGLTETSTASVIEVLDRLVVERVMIAFDDGFGFRSPAVRSIVTGAVSPVRQGLVRRQAALVLEGHGRSALDTWPNALRPAPVA